MARLNEGDPAFTPGEYPLVIVGSGPGALQLSYSLHRLGVEHAVISKDPAPGGMFRRWPFFQRLLSWTKPFAAADRRSRAYERFDWNSLLSDDPQHRAIVAEMMDGNSHFPTRMEMERGLVEFARRTDCRVRYNCAWEWTRREERPDGPRFVLGTSDGEYVCGALVVAVGVAEPAVPTIPGAELVPHYADVRPADTYAGKRVFVIGKQNSGFELASGLLGWARQIVLASPSTTRLSVNTRSLVGVRARYVQPYEDHVLGGGVLVLDAAITRIEQTAGGYLVRTRAAGTQDVRAEAEEAVFEVDDVISATGFTAPLRDLPDLGVATFGQSGLPAQTPWWESVTVPGIFFTGTLSQGATELRKHGLPSNSGAVHGARYNARVLADRLATTRFGRPTHGRAVPRERVVEFVLAELTESPELWHQRAYLARVLELDAGSGSVVDRGVQPLVHILDAAGPDAVAITLEANATGSVYPVLYLRIAGRIEEHVLDPDPVQVYSRARYKRDIAAVIAPLTGQRVATD